jgi:hypothetical protein
VDTPARTGTAAPLYVSVFGTVRAVHAASPRQRDVLAREWARCLVPAAPEDRVESLAVRPESPDQVTGYALASRLTRAGIRDLRGRYVLLHGCGLADDRGRVLALVARSGQGKTTAASTLGRSGLGYVTDETVAVAPDGRVLPYPKPLSVVDPDAPTATKIQHSPDDLGLGIADETLELGRLVVLDRDPSHGAPRIERLGLVDGLLELIPQTSSLYRLPRPLSVIAQLVTRAGGVHRLSYREIDDAAPLLHDLIRSDVAGTDDWEAAEGEPNPDDMLWALRDGRYRRRPYLDVIRVGAEALVMVGDVPMRLSGLGLAIWDACGLGATTDAIEQAVVTELGEHPDAGRLVARGVADLVDAGVISSGTPVPVATLLSGASG